MSEVLILDGYVDEPALLGVPPYMSPEPRMMVGVCEELGVDWDYKTIDEIRQEGLPESEILMVYGGVTVPGKYLGGYPMSVKEAEGYGDTVALSVIGGPMARYDIVTSFDIVVKKDPAAVLYEILKHGRTKDRWAVLEEQNRWSKNGAVSAAKHPYFPERLIGEIHTYRGCVRYFTGGCSFCTEPDHGRPEFRNVKDIIDEIRSLYSVGVRNFRLGGQSCIISYGTKELGTSETPRPDPMAVRSLFQGIWDQCPDIKVLHVDNANPAVMAEHPTETKEILDTLVEYTTPGNVLALGMESADIDVIEQNNLNAEPEQVKTAVELIDQAGRERGYNGMPKLLPGLNFIGGLKGETPGTYDMNFKFLKDLVEDGMWIRRINIRQVLAGGVERNTGSSDGFHRFKEKVRKEIDGPMLKKIVPEGTVLKEVFMEIHRGKTTFGRQIGTYPLLVGVEYPLDLDRSYDIVITDHGYRSVTGVHHPFVLNEAGFKQITSLPGIGDKRAAAIFRARPSSFDELVDIIDDPKVVDRLKRIVTFI